MARTEGSGARNSDGRRRLGGASLRAALLVPFLLVGCDAAPTPDPSAIGSSPGPTQAGPRSSPTPVPVPTPTGDDGITPASDRLVAHVEAFSDVGGGDVGIFLYDDGSLVDARGLNPTVRALSPAGLGQVVSAFRDSGLFTESRLIPPPPVEHGFMAYRVSFVDTGRTVTVTATNVGPDVDSRALVALAEALREPEGWIGADGWVDGSARQHPYRARSTRITSELLALPSDTTINPARTISRLAWPLAVDPILIGESQALGGARRLRCGLITGQEERDVRAALGRVGEPSGSDGRLTTEWHLWTLEPALLKLTVRPFLPHETPGCDLEDLPGPPDPNAAPGASLSDILRIGLGGWTPAGEPQLVVMSHPQRGTEPRLRVSYYGDGTIVWHDPPPPLVGYGVRRLSPAGQAAISQLLDASELVDETWMERVPDGATYDRSFNILRLDPRTGHEIVVYATDRGVNERATASVRLAEQLIDPVAWLPSSAWLSDPAVLLPYRPRTVVMTIETLPLRGREPGGDPLVPLAALRWPLGGTFETFGQRAPEYEPAIVRVARLTPESALAAIEAFAAAGATGSSRFEIGGSTVDTYLEISFAIEAGEWGI